MPRGRPKSTVPHTPSPKTTVTMDMYLHRRLKLLAADESAREDKKVSVADLVEAACNRCYPPTAADGLVHKMTTAAVPVTPPGQMELTESNKPAEPTNDDSGDEFNQLLAAALADPIPDVICMLTGGLEGSFGNPIARSALAYHLRSAINAGRAICTLDELIVDYQG